MVRRRCVTSYNRLFYSDSMCVIDTCYPLKQIFRKCLMKWKEFFLHTLNVLNCQRMVPERTRPYNYTSKRNNCRQAKYVVSPLSCLKRYVVEKRNIRTSTILLALLQRASNGERLGLRRSKFQIRQRFQRSQHVPRG